MQFSQPYAIPGRLVSLTAYAYSSGRFFWLTGAVPVTRKVRRLASLKGSK